MKNINTDLLELWKSQVKHLESQFGEKIEEIRLPEKFPTDMPILYFEKNSLMNGLHFLKNEPNFEYHFLVDITATDEEKEPRFEVIYHLFSHIKKARIRVKVRIETKIAEQEGLPTATFLWKGANWAEREVYDMFGIKFKNHPDLRRILMDSRWIGHPLRKDYPLKGYQLFTEAESIHPELLE